ncbi:MAG: aldo/keto reductase [Azonexus sp.]
MNRPSNDPRRQTRSADGVNISRRKMLKAGLAVAATTIVADSVSAQAARDLLTKAVPSTGVRLPVIGIGTNRFRTGDPAWTARLRDTLSAFSRLGGKVIDTAPSYGDSEQAIGTLLADTGLRERVFLATKLDRDSVADGRQRLAASFAALGTRRLDLVQLHNLRGAESLLPLLREQQAAGSIGHIGITSSNDSQYAEMEAIMRRERLDFIQVDYAVGNRSAGERLLPLAADRGMAVLANLPFGRGAQFRAVSGRPLPGWADDIDCQSWAQVFLKYVVSHPAVTCAIPGSTQVAHVEDNLGAARGRLPDERMRQRIASYFDAIVDG